LVEKQSEVMKEGRLEGGYKK